MIAKHLGEKNSSKWSDEKISTEIYKQINQKREFEKIHISKIQWGDTVFHNGKVRTVGKTDIKHKNFMGSSLLGDSYKLGKIPVIRLIYNT